jgi:response regulator NasT
MDIKNGLQMLIGEDDPAEAEAFRAMLESLGHRVAGLAHDGRDAVTKAESLDVNVVFLDIKMPRLDGIEATREIMARRPVPIILVTGHSDPQLIDTAVAAGVMGYLVKPLDVKELRPAISLALARFADLMALREDVRTLQGALAARKDLERAKGILRRRMGLSEADAHRRLQQFARRERCTLAEAAAKVLAGDKFFADLEKLT